MTREGWIKLLRFLATTIGIGIWAASVYFSAIFFGVKNEKLVWVGVLIAVAVTMLELVWRKPGMKGNVTINILAITAYTYGIITNTLGIMLAWGYNGSKVSELWFFANLDSLLLAIFPGIILEVLAEPLVTWGLIGDAMADLLGNTVDMLNNGAKEFNQSNQNNNENRNGHNNNGKNQNRQRNNHNNQSQNNYSDNYSDNNSDNENDYLDQPMGREVRQNMGNHKRHNQPEIISSNGNNNSSRKNRNNNQNNRRFGG